MVFQEQWGGLEVLPRSGHWQHVEPVKNAIVVNIADCLQRWSNNTLRSTCHRVRTDPRIVGDQLPVPRLLSIGLHVSCVCLSFQADGMRGI